MFFTGNGVIRGDYICFSYRYAVWNSSSHSSYNFGASCNNCKKSTNVVLLPTKPTRVYYNTINQTIIIDEALQNQSLTLVLYDIQGKMLLRKINVSNFINIAHLPQGVYVYRLLQEN
jgi:hypothetical protein